MVMTRKQRAERLIRDVCDLGTDSPLERCLEENSLMDPNTWMTLDDATIKALQYTDSNSNLRYLVLGHYHKLRIFREMINFKHTLDLFYDRTDISQADFELFMKSRECVRLMLGSSQVNIVVTSAQAELATFRKGIKRDAALYTVFNQDAQWDTWNRSLVSIARVQAVKQVLDPTYTPVLPDEFLLFEEKQKYMYAVFERTMQTDKGRAIVQRYEKTFDTQKVYKEMFEYRTVVREQC